MNEIESEERIVCISEEGEIVMKYLEDKGFEIALIEDSSDYTVKISKSNKYAAILKNLIESYVEKIKRLLKIYGR
jgi:hypothetical protein